MRRIGTKIDRKGVGANLVMVLFVCHAGGTYRHLEDKRSREDALEEQPGAGLEESEALALARPVGEEQGAVAGAADHPGLLPPPRRGLRGALTDRRASLGCR